MEKKSTETWLAIDIGVRNLSYCILDEEQIYDWQHVDLLLRYTPYKSFKQMKLMHISALRDLLCQDLFQAIQVHHVVIEQQPFGSRGGSQKLGLLSHLLFEYFKSRRSKSGWPASVCIQPAQSKYCKAWLSEFKQGKKRVYKQRKQLSILLCEALLKARSYDARLRPGPKRDDYADSFLLGRYAIEFKPRLGTLAQPISDQTDSKTAERAGRAERVEEEEEAEETEIPARTGVGLDPGELGMGVGTLAPALNLVDPLVSAQVSSRAGNGPKGQSCLLLTTAAPVAQRPEAETGSPLP